MTANTIKLIAILAMTLDHAAWFLFPGYARAPLPLVMHLIGRITCPIMCYFVAEGYHHTRNVKRYTARMLIFALLSHFAYFFAFRRVEGLHSFLPFADGNLLNQTSVMWPLACGLLMLRAVNSERIRSERQKEALVLLLELLQLLELLLQLYEVLQDEVFFHHEQVLQDEVVVVLQVVFLLLVKHMVQQLDHLLLIQH